MPKNQHAPGSCLRAVRASFTASVRGRFLRTCLLAATVSATLLADALADRALAQAPQQGLPPARVEVTQVVERKIAAGRTFSGTVVPRRKSVVGSAVDGRIVEVYLDAGERVTEVGQPLVQLRTKALEIEIAAAEAELELRQQELAELKRSLPEQLVQAEASLGSAIAQSDYARSQYQRLEQLYRQSGGISQEELAQARSAAIAAEHAVRAAEASKRLLEPGQQHEKIRQAEARVKSQQEMINQLEDRLEKHTLRAPFVGFVTAKHTEVGAWIRQGDPAVEVLELDPIEVEVFVPEEFIASVQVGSSAHLELDSLAAGMLAKLEPVVDRIVPQADLRSRSFPVRVRLQNPDFQLKAGMLARVTLPVGGPEQALMVPKDAVVLGGAQPAVVVVEKQGAQAQARVVPVRLGVPDGAWIQVTGEIQAGQQVVIRGNERLLPGQPLIVAESTPGAAPANDGRSSASAG